MTLQCHARASVRQGPSARDLGTLFGRCSAGDARAREMIIVAFLPYAHHLAHRYRGRGEPIEDLYQAASIGLIKAVDRYDPTRGCSFLTFAKPTILGELRRHLRDKTLPLHVPRSVKDRAGRVACAREDLRAGSGSDPSIEVIARHLGLEPGGVAEARCALNSRRPQSLDATDAGEDSQQLALNETLGELDREHERVETFASCVQALRGLAPRHCEVLLLRFGGELPQNEIARRIGVSQMQVSRILRKATAAMAAAAPELQ